MFTPAPYTSYKAFPSGCHTFFSSAPSLSAPRIYAINMIDWKSPAEIAKDARKQSLRLSLALIHHVHFSGIRQVHACVARCICASRRPSLHRLLCLICAQLGMGYFPRFWLAIYHGEKIVQVANGAHSFLGHRCFSSSVDFLFPQQILSVVCVDWHVRSFLASVPSSFTHTFSSRAIALNVTTWDRVRSSHPIS